MTKDEYKKSAYDMLYVISCLINDLIPDPVKLNSLSLTNIYEVAYHHSLLSITAMALEKFGIKNLQFEQAKWKAIRRMVLFNTERKEIINIFDLEGIWYMPLKGAYIQNLYPKIGMREMSDNDILIDPSRTHDVKKIMMNRGYKMFVLYGTGHDDGYFKAPVLNFEMHHKLFDADRSPVFSEYYDDIKKKLIKDEDNKYGYHFSNEDFYIYMISHEYKHYSNGGTGLRSLLDTYIFLKNFEKKINFEYISSQLNLLEIYDFEKKHRMLSFYLFSGHSQLYTENSELNYYIFSGTYGNMKNSIRHKLGNKTPNILNKLNYVIERVFLPIESIKARYPFFYKCKVLIPFLIIYRIGRMFTVSRKQCINEIKELIKTSEK